MQCFDRCRNVEGICVTGLGPGNKTFAVNGCYGKPFKLLPPHSNSGFIAKGHWTQGISIGTPEWEKWQVCVKKQKQNMFA